jgi:UDP-glucose 4-epimerase
MKKVLITGGCGYLGARLSKYLAENGYRVTVFDNFNPSNYSQWTSLMEEIIVGDIRDETTISNLADKEYDAVIHLISLDHRKSEDNPSLVSSLNVMPTWNLLDKFAKKGLKKFIYFSTIQVYGKIPYMIITEEYASLPQNAYGLTHLLSENICNYYNRKTDIACINVRLSNSYGSPVFKENNCWWLVINEFCKAAVEHNTIKLLSDGSPQRDFIHSSDICRAVEILIEVKNDELQENIFHIASGNTLTIMELAHMVKRAYEERYHSKIPIYLPDKSISNDLDNTKIINKYSFDTTRMKKLGFDTQANLETGTNELFDYLEKHYENK